MGFFLLGHFSLLTRAFYPLRKSKLAQLEGVFYVDLIPEGQSREDLSHKGSFLPYLFLSLSTVLQSDSEQMFVRERPYLLLLLGLRPRAVTECALGLQAAGAKKDAGSV